MKNLLKISIISIILCILISVPVLAKTGKVVNTEEVRFREKASATEDSKVLGQVKQGEKVEILEKITGWYKVQYNGKTGYINSAYLEEVADEQPTQTKTEEPSKPAEEPVKPVEETKPETTNNQTNPNTTGTTCKTTQKVSVRLMPLINSNIISELEKGIEGTIVEQAGNWVYIETSTIKGWVLVSTVTGSQSQITNTTAQTSNSTSKKGYVNTNQINVRKTPSTSAELVDQLQLNTEVTIINEEGDWYKIELNGKEAYVYKPLISDSKK